MPVSMSVLLQGVHKPRLLAEGTYHRGLAAFIATEAGGGPLSIEVLRSRPQLAEQVVQSLAAVHQHGVLHGDVQLHNFVVAPDNMAVWLLAFEHRWCKALQQFISMGSYMEMCSCTTLWLRLITWQFGYWTLNTVAWVTHTS